MVKSEELLPSTRPKNNDGCLLSFRFVSHLQNTIPKIVEPIFRSDFLCLTMILSYFFRCHSLLLKVFIQFEAYYQLNFFRQQNCTTVKFEFSLVLAVNYLFLVRVSQLLFFVFCYWTISLNHCLFSVNGSILFFPISYDTSCITELICKREGKKIELVFIYFIVRAFLGGCMYCFQRFAQ